VDRLLDILLHLRLAHGMAVEEHHGFNPRSVPEIFGSRGELLLIRHRKFQLGLNNLFVFEKQ
jgi:hypothetical protein